MNKIKLTCSFLLLFPLLIEAQIFPKEGDDVGSLIPENYILKEVIFGDLNGDDRDDLVIVIRDKKTKIKSVAIYYSKSNSWNLISESEKFFLLENTDIFNPEITNYEVFNDRVRNEEYVYLSIENQVITISTTDGWGNSIDAKFKSKQSGRYDLIGIDISSYASSISRENSINYLTGKMQTTSKNMSVDNVILPKNWTIG